MKAVKVIMAVCVAAMFIALPVLSADGVDATSDKSWTDGEAAAYYKATGINDVETAGKLYDLKSLASFSHFVGNVDSYNVTKVTDLTIECGVTDKVADSKDSNEKYEKVEGKLEFTATMAADGKFVTEDTTGVYKGDMYAKINEYFGDLKKGDLVKYSSNIKYIEFDDYGEDYTEISTAYANTGGTYELRLVGEGETQITIGDKTVTVYVDEDVTEKMAYSYKFDPALTKESAIPSNAKMTVTYDVSVEKVEMDAKINDQKYSMTIDEDKFREEMKKQEFTDKDVSYYSCVYEVKASASYTNITDGFSSSDEAKNYITDKGYECSEDYSKVNGIINDAKSSGSSSNDNTTLYIIIGVIVAIVVIALIAVVIIKKKK